MKMKVTVNDVLPLACRLYHEEALCTRHTGNVGGHLHIVLDDGNERDSDVQFCLDEALQDKCDTCITIARLLLRMSKTQRLKLSFRFTQKRRFN
jgi:hypothetical protein